VKGKEIGQDSQVWFDVPVAAENNPVFYQMVRMFRQNTYGLEQARINPNEEKTNEISASTKKM
jgi:hypothetical protein